MSKQSVYALFATPVHKINRLIVKFKKLKKSAKENNWNIRVESKKKLKLYHLEYIKSDILSNKYKHHNVKEIKAEILSRFNDIQICVRLLY